MERFRGQRVLVTGASSGIGRACVVRFAAEGARVFAWARRRERLDELAAEIRALRGEWGLRADGGQTGEVAVTAVDVRDRAVVNAAAAALLADNGAPEILVNAAGLAAGLDPLQEGDPDDWDRMIDTNVKGLLAVTRALLPAMIERGVGHVVNIGSTAGHITYPRGNVYCATTAAVRALTEGISLDLAGTPIRISSIDPGMVETEFSVVRFHGDRARAEDVYRGVQPLTADDIADIVAFVTAAPPHVNILDVVVYPTAQRNVYVVARNA